jgi:tetratricopeptide (TPR) repeat protein
MFTAYLNVVERYADAARTAVDCLALCDKYGIAQFTASTRVMLGRAKAGLGEPEEGVALMRDGIAEMQAKSVRVAMTRYVTWLAEGYLQAGRFDAALASAEEALTVNPREYFYRPESIRIRGVIKWKAGQFGQAEQDFFDAEQLARQMGAARYVERAIDSLRSLRLDTALKPA